MIPGCPVWDDEDIGIAALTALLVVLLRIAINTKQLTSTTKTTTPTTTAITHVLGEEAKDKREKEH